MRHLNGFAGARQAFSRLGSRVLMAASIQTLGASSSSVSLLVRDKLLIQFNKEACAGRFDLVIRV